MRGGDPARVVTGEGHELVRLTLLVRARALFPHVEYVFVIGGTHTHTFSFFCARAQRFLQNAEARYSILTTLRVIALDV